LSAEFTADYLYHLIQRSNNPNPTPNDSNVNHSSNNQSNPKKATANKTPNKQPIKRAIKSVIMEQQIVVGVGNIYATESLYLSGIYPAKSAQHDFYDQIVSCMDYIEASFKKTVTLRCSTLLDFNVASGQADYFQQTLNVYDRQGETCTHCDTLFDNVK